MWSEQAASHCEGEGESADVIESFMVVFIVDSNNSMTEQDLTDTMKMFIFPFS